MSPQSDSSKETPPGSELVLLILSESEIGCGFALADRIVDRSGFDCEFLVASENSSILKKLIADRCAELPENRRKHFTTQTVPRETEPVLSHLTANQSLRVLLLPGLDQLSDLRKTLLRQIHATVVCFETHSGLESEPSRFRIVGEDEGRFANWFCEHVVAYPSIQKILPENLTPRQAPDLDQPTIDVILLSASRKSLDTVYKRAKSAMDAAIGPVVLIRGEDSWIRGLLERQLPGLVQKYIPQMERNDRRQLSEQLRKYSHLDFEFIALVSAATFLASFGLLQNSAAVIIGAMLVAPLMTPILGAGLSLAHGNRPLFRDSLKTISIGFFAALITSCLFGLLVRFLSPAILAHSDDGNIILTSEMWSRTHPTSIDFLVGLVGGSAAAFARTRSHLADAMAGAAIAAALVPPIATAGLHLSMWPQSVSSLGSTSGTHHLFIGPVLLFLANMLTIMIGSSFVLWACGVRGDHRHSNRDRWSTRMTALLLTLTAAVLVWIIQHP